MLDKIGINPLYLIGQIVNFAILFFVFSKFLFKPILAVLEKRSKKIQEGLKTAEENIKEKEKLEELKKEEVAKAKKQAAEILSQAKKEAEEKKQEILSQAKKEAEEKKQEEYKLFKEQLKKEEKKLEEKIGELTVRLSKKLLEKTLNKPLQEKIFAAQLKRLRKIKAD